MNPVAWQRFLQLPMPSRHDVDWRHLDLRALRLERVEKRTQPARVTFRGQPPTGVIFGKLSGHRTEANRFLGKAIAWENRHKFVALHEALWEDGAVVLVPKNCRVTDPLEIHYELPNHDSAAFPRTLIVLEPGAEATVVQKYTGAPSLQAGATELFVQPGAHLHYISLHQLAPTSFDFLIKRARVAQDAEIDWVIGMFGAALGRYDIECEMEGRGGSSFMYGVGLGAGQEQLAQFTHQHHRSGDTTSDLLFKNVLRDRAVSSYTGTIRVEKNCNGTNAYQSNRNLVLSREVQCDTRPVLEIESNQLRCTHGATVGRLDDNQMFYLRSRGLNEAQARQILIEAFLEPVLARIRVDTVRREFEELIRQKIIR
ncbi:MAG: Fe-S cluster assembly protein SufD [Verrucomicrobiae bacterium]|nr:Fe-S cluster assembly protein SufD [Verrucomicrobiae bacterium]MDW8344660.1 Fe-S cluster assembly protein SufD [Verrucomicrobiae bacterium]